MFRSAMDAADYAIAAAEERLDRRIGEPARVLAGKICGALVLGVPAAWFINGRKLDGVMLAGLGFGVLLYAAIDAVRGHYRRRRTER